MASTLELTNTRFFPEKLANFPIFGGGAGFIVNQLARQYLFTVRLDAAINHALTGA